MPNAIRSNWRAPAKIVAIWIGASAIGCALNPCTVSAQAAPPAKDEADKKALDAKREQLKENRKREQEIQKDLAALAAERVKITEESRLLAGKVQKSENQLSNAEGKLSELDGQEKALRSSLTERYGKISKLLSVLQRMGRNPPPVMITKREDALKMVRSAMLIAAAFPEMRAQAVSLSAKLNELVKVMDGVREERAKTEAYAKDLKDKRQQLDGLMETKRQLYAQKQTDLQSVRTAAAEIAKGAEKLSELIAKVDQTVAKNTELGAYNEEAKAQELNPDAAAPPPGGAPNALELTPAAKPGKSEPLRPLIAFNLAKAKLPLPAAGRRVLSFGEKTQYGAQSKGIVIETRAFAQVTSPCDGWIVFAGEFRSYGRVLIINPGGGYHVLMAGLSQIDVSTGQFVVAGEPVANMSGGAPSAAQTAQASAPVLYIEFRKDGEPIDPDPWWVASKQVESGKKGARMMHKKDYAFWSVVMVAGAVGATAVLNVSNLQSAPSQNADIYRKIDLFGEVFERVRQDYVEKPDEGAMIESAINGMLAALDPHSSYMPPKDYRDMQVQTRGEFGGLGIEVTMENGVIKVVSPIDDTPAAKAGLQANDLITHLDNEQIVGLTLQQAVDKMRGPVNTPITLTIVRKGKDEPFDVKVTRDVIHINAVKQRAEKDVAYIKVSTFNEQTHTNLVKAMESLKTSIGADLKGYVIDLRNNPGGLLDQAIAVSDDFLDRGAIVLTKGRDNAETQRAQARPGDMSDGKPVVILINGGSASASEIVAGALQDHKRATVIGTRSFGKGSVQTIIPLGNNEGAIRLTTARYYTPSNRSIQAKGIDPDVVVEQELPEELKGKNPERPRGEASLRGHLRGEEKKAEDKKAEEAKAAAAKSEAKPADPAVKPEGEDGDDEGAMVKPDEKKEVSGSSSYVPKEPEKDTQLQYALNLLRGNVVGAAALAQPSTAPSASPASPSSGDKAAVPN